MKPGSDRVLVFGGAGVFGRHVGRELARRGARVTIAGRDGAKAATAAAALPAVAAGPHAAIAVDLTDEAAVLRALAGHAVVANCTGPFRELGAGLLDAAIAARCHVVDIADDRGYVRQVRARSEALAAVGLVAVTGASSLPGISGALALLARQSAPGEGPPQRARVTLFIGNDNDKGGAAIRSAVAAIGRRLDTPQGPVRGFGDREVVRLPEPFGRRAVYNFDAPDLDLLPALVGAREVSVKVGFELRLATTGAARRPRARTCAAGLRRSDRGRHPFPAEFTTFLTRLFEDRQTGTTIRRRAMGSTTRRGIWPTPSGSFDGIDRHLRR